MSGYQPFEQIRPMLSKGPPSAPVVDRALVGRADLSTPPHVGAAAYRRKNDITGKQVKWMRAERSKGISQRVIAEAIGCSVKCVWNYTHDIPAPPGGWLAKQKRKIANVPYVLRLRSEGWTYDRIAAHLGVTRYNVYDAVNGGDRHPSYKHIRTAICARSVVRVFGFSARQLRSAQHERRGRVSLELAKARHVLFWLVKRANPQISLTQIGRKLGGFNHSSLINGLRNVERVIQHFGLLLDDSPFRAARALHAVDWREAAQ